MKVIGFLAPATATLAIVLSVAGRADDTDVTASRRAVQSVEGVQGKIQYCKDCHGLSAQGYYGFLTMPRLAGQKPEYIENQLRAFAERRWQRDFPEHGQNPRSQPGDAHGSGRTI